MEGEVLPFVWLCVIGFAIFMYVLLDGFVLGAGILFSFLPRDADRDTLMTSVAPIWDGNETWLVLGAGGLFAAFPLAYSIVLPALYLPFMLMLLGLVFRGIAFEFRFKAKRRRHVWDRAFQWGSIAATFCQGLVLGAFVEGFDLDGTRFVGGSLAWASPFGVVTGLALVAGYALLGATWLIMKAPGDLEAWARRVSARLLLLVLVLIARDQRVGTVSRQRHPPALVLSAELLLLVAGAAAHLDRGFSALAHDALAAHRGAVSADARAVRARLRGSRDQSLAEHRAALDPVLGGRGRAIESNVPARRAPPSRCRPCSSIPRIPTTCSAARSCAR